MTPTNNTVDENLVNKIRKLLALGNVNTNQNEAELALMKAKQLAVEYEIDLSTIKIFDEKVKPEPIVKGEAISNGSRMPVCQKFVTWILTEHFNVKVIYSGSRAWGRSMTFIGKKIDIEMATFVNSFLNEEFMRLWHKYQSQNNLRASVRNSYIYGLYQGLNEKLKQAKKSAEDNKFSSMTNAESVRGNYQLMVVNDKKRLEDAVEDFYPRLRKLSVSVGRAFRSDIIGDGQKQGRNISINRPIGNSQRMQIA